jgi:hypothetical protein
LEESSKLKNTLCVITDNLQTFEFMRNADYDKCIIRILFYLKNYEKRLGSSDWDGDSRAAGDGDEDFLRVCDEFRGGAEFEYLSGLSGFAGGFAGFEPACRRFGGAGGAGFGVGDSGDFDFCAEELFLSGFAERVSDFAV